MNHSLRFAALCATALACNRPAPPPIPLRIALPSAPTTLDPHLHDERVTRTVLEQLYEGLTAFDPDMRVVPALATRWESPDDVTWRFHLRAGVRFHDGRPLSAGDVAASLDRARTHPRSKVSGYLVAVRSVRVVDSLSVEVRTERPYPVLLNKLTFVAVVPPAAPPEIIGPVGTGPYRVVGRDSAGGLALEAFTDYWRGPAAARRVELRFVPDGAERVRLLLAGGVAFVGDLGSTEVASVEAAPCCRVVSRASLSVSHLAMRVDARPFSDPRVRRAIALALDRQAVVDTALRGLGKSALQLVSPEVFGYVADVRPVERDLGEARRLLAEAGFRNGLDLTLEHAPGVAPLVAVVQGQLAAAGIRVSARARPWSELYGRLVGGRPRFWFAGWACSSGDASDLFEASIHTRDSTAGYGASNFTGYSNPRLDRLIELSGETLDMRRRGQLLEDGMRLLIADPPMIPLSIAHRNYALRRDITWQPRLDAAVHAYDMRPQH